MSNSPLVDFTKISPNKTSPRNRKIDTITIHCYVGQASVESMGNWFAEKSANCSCNYAIGFDGRMALIVDENDRSWCSSNKANDNRAITIECASDREHPYAINDKVYDSLIKLCADICKRNGIKKLLWKADKSLIGQVDKQNMTVHRWFANKECPGDYIYKRLGTIAEEVNVELGIEVKEESDDFESYFNKIPVSDSNILDVSKVVYGEAGIIKSYEALLGAAQCIHDMLESGKFGNTVTQVMKNNFHAYGTADTTDEACKAVYDVFYNKKLRFKDAKVLQFRSLKKYSDGNGNMDKEKCADLLNKYSYLGKDVRNNEWGHLYFGTKNVVEKEEVKEPAKEEVKINPEYKVKVSISNLNIRTGAGTNYAKTGHFTGVGVFTIVETKEGTGSKAGWGRLKSGAGWISLDHATRL